MILLKAGIPSIKELQGPDGLSLTPWREGRYATWDVTVADSVAASYLNNTASRAGSAAEAAASRKEEKYSEIVVQFHFLPLAFETFGTINQAVVSFFPVWAKRGELMQLARTKLEIAKI